MNFRKRAAFRSGDVILRADWTGIVLSDPLLSSNGWEVIIFWECNRMSFGIASIEEYTNVGWKVLLA